MKQQIIWLRISYWVPALGDFLIAVLVLIPEANGETHYSLPMGMMASAAFSWGVMLLYGDRKPLERRWMLLPTMLVVLLIGTAMAHGGFTGIIPALRAVVRVTVFLSVFALLLFSYLGTRKLPRE